MKNIGKKRSTGSGRNVVLAALALGTLLFVGYWPRARATPPSEAETLSTLLASPLPEHRKAQMIETLRRIENDDARDRLTTLADSTDDRLACLAIRALGRAGFQGALTKIAGVYEDTTRSDLVRCMALVVWCQKKAAAGVSWSDCKQWVKSAAGSNSMLCDQYRASLAKLWPNEEE